MTILMNSHFPYRDVKVHEKYKLWVTKAFKKQILEHQKAWFGGDNAKYSSRRNAVNRMETSPHRTFYHSQIKKPQEVEPKHWWKTVKQVMSIKSDPSAALRYLASMECDGNMEKRACYISIFFQSVSVGSF